MTPYSVAMLGSMSGSITRYVRSCTDDRRRNSASKSSVLRQAACPCGVLRRKNAVTRIGSRRLRKVLIDASETMNWRVAVVSTRNHPGGSVRLTAQISR